MIDLAHPIYISDCLFQRLCPSIQNFMISEDQILGDKYLNHLHRLDVLILFDLGSSPETITLLIYRFLTGFGLFLLI